jgi:putative addiction module component (TIGR02574 family)
LFNDYIVKYEKRKLEMRVCDIPEKILLVEELWDNIALDEASVPVLQSHVDELNRRFKSYKSAPENLLSLEELQLKIKGRDFKRISS